MLLLSGAQKQDICKKQEGNEYDDPLDLHAWHKNSYFQRSELEAVRHLAPPCLYAYRLPNQMPEHKSLLWLQAAIWLRICQKSISEIMKFGFIRFWTSLKFEFFVPPWIFHCGIVFLKMSWPRGLGKHKYSNKKVFLGNLL